MRLSSVWQHHIFLVGVLCAALQHGCQHRYNAARMPDSYGVLGTRLRLPKIEGWVRDSTLAPAGGHNSGPVLRLVRPGGVLGAPRIEVVLAPLGEAPILEDFLTGNLRAMGELEASGQIHILRVEQQHITVGSLPAYRVQHEYTMGDGHAQVSLRAVSVFLVLDGRGMTVAASGRTELFHPLADAIAEVLDGMRPDGEPEPAAAGDGPIDLGRVGGGQPS